MGITDDPESPCIKEIRPDGQQECYLVLSEAERAKGFVRLLRQSYRHLACGGVTRMGLALSETYARDPKFYGGTFCCNCGRHFALVHADPADPSNPSKNIRAFVWVEDGTGVGT